MILTSSADYMVCTSQKAVWTHLFRVIIHDILCNSYLLQHMFHVKLWVNNTLLQPKLAMELNILTSSYIFFVNNITEHLLFNRVCVFFTFTSKPYFVYAPKSNHLKRNGKCHIQRPMGTIYLWSYTPRTLT